MIPRPVRNLTAYVRAIMLPVLLASGAIHLLPIAVSAAPLETVVRPKAASGPVDNPLKGWCPFTDAGEITLPYAMVFFPVAWNELEPQDGEFAFERTENRKRAVIGGEMDPNQARKRLGAHYDHTQKMTDETHFTWVGPYCPALEQQPDREFTERAAALVRKIGYQLTIQEIRHAASVSKSDKDPGRGSSD